MPEAEKEDILDRPGRWEIRTTIYRNGRRVGTVDTAEWNTFDDAAYWVGEGLSTREIDLHEPKRRVHTPHASAPYEPCVLDADGRCTRWSHDHSSGITSPPGATS